MTHSVRERSAAAFGGKNAENRTGFYFSAKGVLHNFRIGMQRTARPRFYVVNLHADITRCEYIFRSGVMNFRTVFDMNCFVIYVM